ncbi:MAG TPA: LamG domain-containing protein [Puia sp.]|jgi:hypothetical protein
MKLKNIFLATAVIGMGLFWACAKNSTPAPPIHDTVTVHKTDTFLKPVDTPNLKIGLLLYLPFNGSFADSSGNANPTAASTGTTLTYDMHGYSSSAYGDNGGGHYVLVTNNGSIKFDTAYSISFDFMQRSPGLQAFLSMVNYTTGYGPSFTVGTTNPGLPNFDIGINDSTAGCDNYGLTDPNKMSDTTTFIPQSERWYNAICTYRKGSVSVYINGQLISTKTSTGTHAHVCPSAQIVVGGWWSGGAESINGVLDEVRLYNRVLSAKEISWLSRNFQPSSTKVRATPVTR